VIKIPGKKADPDELGQIYDQEFFRMHADNMPAFKALARLIDEANNHGREQSIIDVGCGHGFLVESLRNCGYKNSYGLEGSSSAEALWPEKFHSFYTIGDLTDKATSLAIKKTDLVCSFETAEHIDVRYAKQYIQLLTQHRPGMIFFGAATLYQDCGLNPTHVNEQPFSYWINHFQNEKYKLDILLTVQIRNSMFCNAQAFSKAWWYPKNILVFRPDEGDMLTDDKEIAELINSEIKWFENSTAPNSLFAMCLMRDRQEYNYIIMDAIAKSVMRLSGSR